MSNDPTAPCGSLPAELFAKLRGGRLANLGDFRVYATLDEAMDDLEQAESVVSDS